MLARMEKTPTAVFYEKELVEGFPADFEWAKRKRLLRRVPTQVDGGSYSFGQGRTLTVVSDDGQTEAFDDEDPEAEPVHLSLADLAQWRLDLETLARSFQEANGLDGKPDSLDDRLFFLGEAERNDCKAAYVLGLLHEPRVAQALLAALPGLLPAGYGRTVVVCPSFEPTPTHRRQLQSLGVSIVAMDSENPFALNERAALEHQAMAGPTVDFQHSHDYRWVKLRGCEFTLTPPQAEIVRILHGAYERGFPDVSWKTICTQVCQSTPRHMSDAFRTVADWREVILSRRKDTYRLNI
jgi:hypothetical protein